MKETPLAVTRRKGTEEEAELAVVEADGEAVVIRLDDGEELIFDAREAEEAVRA